MTLKSLIEDISATFVATEDEKNARLAICHTCTHCVDTSWGFKQCNLCNCFVDAKTKSKQSKCPINLW